MSKINNKNLISLGIGLLVAFSFVLVSIPGNVKAATCQTWWEGDNYVGSCESGNNNNSNTNNVIGNPVPFVSSISPNSTNININATITVYGNNFMPSSIIEWNGYDVQTTFVDSGTLRMQLDASALKNGGSYPISVSNPGPGGGISNSVMFTVKNVIYTTTNVSRVNTVNTSVTNRTVTNTNNNTAGTNNSSTSQSNNNGNNSNGNQVGSLAAGAIFGSNAFLPSSLLQWIFFIILILLAIVLWRKLYISEEEKNKPLKHA